MSDFWNQRYADTEYIYGTKPNQFYKEQLGKLSSGEILFPAEGEGRNAVYAATQGWKVSAFDPSTEGQQKALSLAKANNVHLKYLIANYENIELPRESFDVIVLTFAHMMPEKRRDYHRKLISFLKPSGKLILEGFSKKQINNNSGGPNDVNMLFSEEELREDFRSLSSINISETETILDEGSFHQGVASVIRIVGIK